VAKEEVFLGCLGDSTDSASIMGSWGGIAMHMELVEYYCILGYLAYFFMKP
jgi:hypothetical protein